MTTQTAFDQEKAEAFVHKAFGDAGGAVITFMCALGDRLGLFKELASGGPATSEDLAQRAGINGRYSIEWLRAMASAGYLDYDSTSRRFSLPPEHAPVLAQESGPVFFGGLYQEIPAALGVFEQVVNAFRQGGGVLQSAYNENMWDGLERFTAGWFENLLLPVWIPAMPDVKSKLEQGASVADVGCGRGRALIKLAQAFPASRYTGYDAFAPTIEKAKANAESGGISDRIRFEVRDVVQGLPEQFDIITTFDVVHDMVNPRGGLKAIRQALKPDGIYVCLEINCADNPEDNTGPLAATLYGISTFYCMTTSLAGNGEGLGTMGLPEAKMRELCTEAGFSAVRRLPLENPFNIVYEVRP